MKQTAQVVVIGGGIVGCSVLYHLTLAGIKDVVLVERAELTSGSTWHAAGGMHTVNADPNVAKLQQYTIGLYREIEKASGQALGLHVTGGVLLAATQDRMLWLKSLHAKGRYLGLDTEIISATEAYALFPLMNPESFVGALYNPLDGHLDPSSATQAFAAAARKNGAEIYRHTRVEALTARPDGNWRVTTQNGAIVAEHVVNAAGLWAREVGRMVGVDLPVLAMEHMYLLTDDMSEVAAINATTGKEVLHAVDFDGELYLRQERGGMLMGTYEKGGKPWSPKVTPWDFGQELLEPDLDRIAPSLELGFRHFPAFQNVGIRKIICGPFTFAPDGNPLLGPVPGLRNFWCACGVMAGFSQAGGVGLALANWMSQGDPGFDVWGMDVARYGDWATRGYTNARVRENYSRRWSIRYPNEELTAARPHRTTPIYDRLLAGGAQMGASFGVELPLWYARNGRAERFSWRRSTDFPSIREECHAVANAVGIGEISGYAKYEVTGAGAAAWLDRLLAGRLPATGRLAMTPMLDEQAHIVGDFTTARLDEDTYLLFGAGVAEAYHMRWFTEHGGADVVVRPLGLASTGLAIAGPLSRELLATVADDDVSPKGFAFHELRRIEIASIPCIVGRISFTGELGYEIWCTADYQRSLFDVLMRAGERFGVRLFGSRALNAMRIEKAFGSWAREYRPIYRPSDCGLYRFVALSKTANFRGKAAAANDRNDGGRWRLCQFVVDAEDADAIGDEPILFRGVARGWVTSGGFGHRTGRSLALGYIPKEILGEEDGWEIEVLGARLAARLQARPIYDPDGLRMHA
jgi:dimethylglycine dehydrogenase